MVFSVWTFFATGGCVAVVVPELSAAGDIIWSLDCADMPEVRNRINRMRIIILVNWPASNGISADYTRVTTVFRILEFFNTFVFSNRYHSGRSIALCIGRCLMRFSLPTAEQFLEAQS